MEVKWNGDLQETYVKEPIGNQTFYMAFQEENFSSDTIYVNVYMTLYNKKTQINSNENQIKTTGTNPIKTLAVARRAFDMLEYEMLQTYHDRNVVFYCTWLDNRRRDIYYWFLSRRGYRYGKTPENKKCIMKKYKKGTFMQSSH